MEIGNFDKADVNKTDKVNVSVLSHAVKKRNWRCVEVLLKARANVEIVQKGLITGLIADSEIEENGNNNTGINGALIYTVQKKYYYCVRILVKTGADLNTRDAKDVSVLELALRNEQYDCAEVLIEEGAKEILGAMLLTGVKQNRPNEWRLRTLMYLGADVNLIDGDGLSFLMYAVQRDSYDFGTSDVIELLVEAGADVNKTDNAGVSVLSHAIRKQNWSYVETLIEAGADVKPVQVELVTGLIEEINKKEESDLTRLNAAVAYTVKKEYPNC